MKTAPTPTSKPAKTTHKPTLSTPTPLVTQTALDPKLRAKARRLIRAVHDAKRHVQDVIRDPDLQDKELNRAVSVECDALDALVDFFDSHNLTGIELNGTLYTRNFEGVKPDGTKNVFDDESRLHKIPANRLAVV
jgi:hypothetical protein